LLSPESDLFYLFMHQNSVRIGSHTEYWAGRSGVFAGYDSKL
jgi:hypothetical protein